MSTSESARVGILVGSESDLPTMEAATKVLDRLGISNETIVASAHRTPDRVRDYAMGAKERGVKVIIAAAGMAAALPGVVAAHTSLPVVGVPLDGSPLQGLDALLAIVQMPPGVPVGTVAIGKAGAKNAAVYAARIMALSDATVATSLTSLEDALARGERI